MTIGHRYDTKLLAYQAGLEIPLQVMMYDLYGKLQPNLTTYTAMGFVNLGLWLANQKLSTALYNATQSTQHQKDTDYYVSFITEYNYKHLKDQTQNIPIADRSEYLKKLDTIQREAPAFSSSYFNLKLGAYALKSTYGAMLYYSKSKNPIGAIAYGLTQPLAVVLKDAKRKG